MNGRWGPWCAQAFLSRSESAAREWVDRNYEKSGLQYRAILYVPAAKGKAGKGRRRG